MTKTAAILQRASKQQAERAKEFKVILDRRESERLRATLDGWGIGSIGVIAGKGHSGYGLYLYSPDYPEEGSLFIGGELA